MKVIEPGHVYELSNLEHPGTQTLTFIKRSSKAVDYKDTEHPGTNTQSVLRALIERTLFLNSIIPCGETLNAVHHLRMALYEYEARAWRRKQEKLNREAGIHNEQELDASRENYQDVPFTEYLIEELPTGPDGHILVPVPEKYKTKPKEQGTMDIIQFLLKQGLSMDTIDHLKREMEDERC